MMKMRVTIMELVAAMSAKNVGEEGIIQPWIAENIAINPVVSIVVDGTNAIPVMFPAVVVMRVEVDSIEEDTKVDTILREEGTVPIWKGEA
jgi:hypothetical protein